LTSGHSYSERQNAWMSKITNDGLTQPGTECFIAVLNTHMTTAGAKGLSDSQNKT